jgi:hypothetical protein
MSSGLPINTFAQAKEYRNRYLANLALTVQNDMYNLNANQVFKQTGQPSRPPDMRSTTEKLADLEGMKVSLRTALLGLTDGTQANETVEQLTPDEIIFASQQLPVITAELKPRFARGVPAPALLNYIRALRKKELATNGVSFTANEATAQSIMNAIQAGMTINGSNAGPIPGGQGNPVNPAPEAQQESSMVSEEEFVQSAESGIGLETEVEWKKFPVAGSFQSGNPVEYLKIWARAQRPDIQELFTEGWEKKRALAPLKKALFPGWQFKQSLTSGVKGEEETPSFSWTKPTRPNRPDTEPLWESGIMMSGSEPTETTGFGIRPKHMIMRRAGQPVSRYPTGREILGYGLSRGGRLAATSQYVGMPMSELCYSPFGKFIVNTNKLSSNILDVRTQKGNQIPKYKQHEMSHHLAKTMKRIMGGRMIDEYDFNEMPLNDQTYLWNLAKDAKIMDRLQLPTPKRTKDGEEENRFEILKGQIMAGNDSKELVKEFKSMLLKFSNDGRIKKSEARELLLDLTALGY